MSDYVGKRIPGSPAPTEGAPAAEGAITSIVPATADVVPSDAGPGALALPVIPDSERAVQAYLGAQLSPRSKQNASDALRRLARLFLRDKDAVPSQIPWAAIGYEQAATIRSGLYEMTRIGAITPGTANLTLSHLRGLIRAMHAMGLVTADQAAMASGRGALKSVPGSRTPRGRALSAREERALREAAKALGGYRGAMLDTAIVLAVGAGLRREEIAKLAVEGLGPAELTVIGKGNKEKRMPIDPQMRIAIDTWLNERAELTPGHGALFCSPQRPDWVLSAWSFWALVRLAAHNAFGDRKPCDPKCSCLKIITGPHDFRRTFATRLLDQGLDIRQVQVLMAHESVETTVRYDKRDIDALFERRRNMRVIA